ncbi:MAG TPA: response regulator [Candidatus Bathyarchaeia archaeon]|nr:response regulator [Candidatus Bathyarchaeia archaeon]
MVETKSILIVDDDETILAILQEILRLDGYVVETASTGKEALEKSDAAFFNLCLLDIKLPDMEGIELITQLNKTNPQMIKIIITGFPSFDNAVKSLNLGADAYVMKPVNSKELLELVANKIEEQEDAIQMSEAKVSDWVKNKIRQIERDQDQH